MNASVSNSANLSTLTTSAVAPSVEKMSEPSSTSNNQGEQGGKVSRYVVATNKAKSGRILVGIWAVGAQKWEGVKSYKSGAEALEAAMAIKKAEGIFISRKAYQLLSELSKAEKAEQPAKAEAAEAVKPAALTDEQADLFSRSGRSYALAQVELYTERLRLAREAYEAFGAVAKKFDGKLLNIRFERALQEQITKESAWVHVEQSDYNKLRHIYLGSRQVNNVNFYASVYINAEKRIDMPKTLDAARSDMEREAESLERWQKFLERYNELAAMAVAAAEIVADVVEAMPERSNYNLKWEDCIWRTAEDIARRRQAIKAPKPMPEPQEVKKIA